MIASENYTSSAVMEAVGSVLTNKYAEGYPNARYYGGCENSDVVEQLAIDRAKKLFNAEHANVQPHSGSQANLAAYSALMNVGDNALALSLDHGGHLTHGHKVNITGKLYNFSHYGVNKDTELIDYDQMRELAKKERPKVIVIGTTAYPRNLDFSKTKEIADEIDAYVLADIAHISGLVATKNANNPFEYSDVVTTTTHKSLRGPRSGMIFCKKEYTELIDSAVFPSLQGGPHNNVIAAVAVALKEADTPDFNEYIIHVKENAKEVGKYLMENGYKLSTNGTENHLILVNLRDNNITGSKVEYILEKICISVNKNAIIGDKSALSPGGIRIGLCAMTTRGLLKNNCKDLAQLIHEGIQLGCKLQTTAKKLVDFKKVVDLDETDEVNELRNKVIHFSKQFSFNYRI